MRDCSSLPTSSYQVNWTDWRHDPNREFLESAARQASDHRYLGCMLLQSSDSKAEQTAVALVDAMKTCYYEDSRVDVLDLGEDEGEGPATTPCFVRSDTLGDIS